MSILRLMFPDLADSALAGLTPDQVKAKQEEVIAENTAILGDVLVTTTTTTTTTVKPEANETLANDGNATTGEENTVNGTKVTNNLSDKQTNSTNDETRNENSNTTSINNDTKTENSNTTNENSSSNGSPQGNALVDDTSESNNTSVNNKEKVSSNATSEEGEETNTNSTEDGRRRKREAADGSGSLNNMVLPTLTGFQGVHPKKGILAKSEPCDCDDPILRLRKEFKTKKSWSDDLLDPATPAFADMKDDLEKSVNNKHLTYDTY